MKDTFKEIFQSKNENLIHIDERPLSELSEEEIENLFQELKQQGLVEGDSKRGYSLTKKGIAKGRLLQLKSFFR